MEPEIKKVIVENPDRPFLRGEALPLEASTFVDEPISTYEEKNGLVYTAVKLGFSQKDRIDHITDTKIRAIDEHIRMQMLDENLYNTAKSYDTIFNRMTSNLGESPESARNSNKLNVVIDNLFMQVSIANKMSSKTHFEIANKRFEIERINRQMKSLKEQLNNLK